MKTFHSGKFLYDIRSDGRIRIFDGPICFYSLLWRNKELNLVFADKGLENHKDEILNQIKQNCGNLEKSGYFDCIVKSKQLD